jgi:hypothetical protein
MTKEKNRLNTLRTKYEKKYVFPLVEMFPKPLVMFDEKQILLKRQIDSLLKKIDESKICQECNGRGIIYRKNDVSLKNLSWSNNLEDSRIIKNDRCMKCFGDGIILSEEVNGFIVPKNGSLIHLSNINKLVCEYCKRKLFWTWSDDLENPCFEAGCHGMTYILKCDVFSVVAKLDRVKEVEG